jgi:glycogen synthase
MQAADLNVMASLWEPFGGAFEGTVLPVGRAVDGLASQIRPYQPSALVRDVAPHDPAAPACGWLFREALQSSAAGDLSALLTSAVPTIRNATYAAMIDACTETLTSAVALHQQQPLAFAELVRNALALQRSRSWASYDRMLELAADAARQRGLSA